MLNVGGGLGIAYTAEDEPPSIDAYVEVKVRGVARGLRHGVRILVEPGRSLVGNAGVTAYRVGTVKEIPGVRTYVAVDGGMSDNLRPMLYGSRYEALIADRAAAPRRDPGDDRRHALRVGRHPRPRRDARRARGRRRPRHARHRRLRPRDGEQLQRRPAPAGDLLPRRRRPRGRPPRDLRGPDRRAMSEPGSEPVRIGLLGHGTVGGAFAELVADRADAVEAATGRTPEIAGVLTRSEGDFDEILAGSDVIVELIGGTDPARDYVLRALRAGKPVVTANKQLLAQHGDELFDAAREAGVQLRFEAAVAGVIPIIRVIQESFGVTEIDKVFGIVNGTTNFILSEMAATGAAYEDVLARAQELGYAEADPTDDVNGADAAAKMAILARLAFHTAGDARAGRLRGDRVDPARRPRLRQGARPLAEAARRRRAPRGRDQRPRLPLLPLPRPPAGADRGPVQRGDGRGARDHRGDDVGARRRRHPDRLGGARRRRLDPLRRGAGARDARASCRSSPTSAPPSTCTSRSPTSPACWPGSPRCWATTRSR